MKLEECYKKYMGCEETLASLKKDVLSYAYKVVSMDKYIEAGEFILTFIPKVEKIIRDYNPNIASFTHYINKHIKWKLMGMKNKYLLEKSKDNIYTAYQSSNLNNTYSIAEQNYEYKICNEALNILKIKDGEIKSEAMKKRLEIFTLKNSRSLTSQQIEILAPLLGRTTEWLYETKETMDKICEKRVKNREYLMERHNKLFISISNDQMKLDKIDNNDDKEKLLKKITEKKDRKEKITKKLNDRHCGPKNGEIADFLGIPKGTVDSSLFYMRKRLTVLLPEINNFE